jgi:hypothetical protein
LVPRRSGVAMRVLDRELITELSWAEPELCQNCAFFVYRNSKFHCSHPAVGRPIEQTVQCKTDHFKKASPYHVRR